MNKSITLAEDKTTFDQMEDYQIGVISNEGYFTVLTEKPFKSEQEAYQYGYDNIQLNDGEWFSVHVKKKEKG